MSTYTVRAQPLKPNNERLVSQLLDVTSWPVLGRQLWVPPRHRAVLTSPDGAVSVLREGLHILQGLPWTPHTVQVVDMRRRHLVLPSVAALTQDGWRANVQASLEYQVRSPYAATLLHDPIQTLSEAAVFAITCVIKTMSHDLLIGISEEASNAGHKTIVACTQMQLRSALRGSGLEVVNIFVGQVEGDERRLEINRQAQVAKTRIAADQAMLAGRLSLEREQQALTVLQAETKRKQAVEEQRIQLDQARIEAEATALVRSVREWEARLQLLPDLSRQRHEQILEAIKAHGQILGKMAELGNLEVLGVSSRRRPEELGLDRLEAVLMQGLVNLQALLAQEPMGLASGNGTPPQNSTSSLWGCLANEIEELSTIEGLAWTHLRPDGDGLRLEVRLNGIGLEITCRPGFPVVRPDVVVSANGHDRMPFALPWAEPRPLKEVVLEAARRFSVTAPGHEQRFSAPAG